MYLILKIDINTMRIHNYCLLMIVYMRQLLIITLYYGVRHTHRLPTHNN